MTEIRDGEKERSRVQSSKFNLPTTHGTLRKGFATFENRGSAPARLMLGGAARGNVGSVASDDGEGLEHR